MSTRPRWIAVCLSGCLLTALLGASDCDSETPPTSMGPHPVLDCAEPTIDLGEIWCNTTHTATWSLHNSGNAPLELQFHPASGYGSVDVPARTVAPGEETRVEVPFQVEWYPDKTRESFGVLRVCSNDPAKQELNLAARARVLRAVRVEEPQRPRDPHLFGHMSRSSGPRTETVTLVRADGGPLTPKVLAVESVGSATLPRAPFHAQAEVRELTAGERYALDITISPPWPNHELRGQVRVATGVAEQPECALSFAAQFDPRLEIRSKSWVPRERTSTFVWRAELQWSKDSPPGHVQGVRTPHDRLVGRTEQHDNQTWLIVEVAPDCPSPQSPPAGHDIVVTTDDPSVPEVPVRVYWEPERPPRAADQ